MKIDLHLHTMYSDGQYSPSDVVKLAKTNNVEYIAITDHDTISGLDEAIEAGKQYSVNVITGVEFSAAEYNNFHILGYNFHKDSEEIISLCQRLKANRDKKKFMIISFLNSKGINISLEEVEQFSDGDVIARPHFAQAMLKRGFVHNYREAFDKYLDTDEYNSIKFNEISSDECINAICSAGGKAVLAHPIS